MKLTLKKFDQDFWLVILDIISTALRHNNIANYCQIKCCLSNCTVDVLHYLPQTVTQSVVAWWASNITSNKLHCHSSFGF